MTDNFINENYTFTKDTFINNELDTSLSYDFYSKNNLNEVLRSMVDFLHASGYEYVLKLVAVKDNGEEHASDEDIDEEMLEILSQVLKDADTAKREKNKPKLEVIVSNVSNDNDSNSTDSS